MGRHRKCQHPDNVRDSTGRCKPCRNVIERKNYSPEKDKLRKEHQTKEFRRQRSEEWRLNNLSRDREIKSNCQKTHLEVGRVKRRRYRARKALAEGSFTEHEWLIVKESQNYRCAHCGESKPLDADHILPLSKGGSDYISNIQGLCRSCNSRKRNFIDREPLLKELPNASS